MGRAALLTCVAVLASACGGGSGNPGGPSPSENPYKLTISAAGIISPTELTVPPGSRVLFINNHSLPHNMTSDGHPAHDECPPINDVGVLNPGQRRETGNLVVLRTCGIHDHDDFQNHSLWARIVIR